MEPAQIILVLTGLAIAAAGAVLMVKSLRGTGAQALRPYVPIATLVVGLAIAYRSYADYRALDGQDITIMFLFVLGLVSLLGLQFFIVDRHGHSGPPPEAAGRQQGDDGPNTGE